MRYRMITKVARVEMKKETTYEWDGSNCVAKIVDVGWCIVTEGINPFSLMVGDEKPTCVPGQEMIITFEHGDVSK